jgi:hypothetical protein
MPAAAKLPPRSKSEESRSEEVLLYFDDAGWHPGSYEYYEATGDDGGWNVWGAVIPTGEVSHWLPSKMPPLVSTADKLPPRAGNGAPHSDGVFVIVDGKLARGTYQFASETGDDGSWEVDGDLIPAKRLKQWAPLPPKPSAA